MYINEYKYKFVNKKSFRISNSPQIIYKNLLPLLNRTMTKWSVRALESCERTKADVLHLQFDTVKRDKQERTYRVEPGLCQQLEKYLRSILSQRPLSEMNLKMYRCVKCSVNFSRDNKGKKAKSGKIRYMVLPNDLL